MDSCFFGRDVCILIINSPLWLRTSRGSSSEGRKKWGGSLSVILHLEARHMLCIHSAHPGREQKKITDGVMMLLPQFSAIKVFQEYNTKFRLT